MTVNELYERLNELFPKTLSCSWDNDGRMVIPDGEKEVKKALCCLDVDAGAIRRALLCGADLILSHHPLIFRPLGALDPADPVAAKALLLYKNGIAVLSFHTRLDCGQGGVNDALAAALGLVEVEEWTIAGLPMGRVGRLPEEISGAQFAELVKKRLECPAVRAVNPEKRVRTVALVGGSGGSNYTDALSRGVDAFLTGEASHHQLLEAGEAGLCLVAAGHDYTERVVVKNLAELLQSLDPAIETVRYEEIAVPTV